jgi:cytidyltransferase-like protein
MLSGGFDPLHTGHVRMINEAAKYGHVVIALNSDSWLRRKKKFCFMPWPDRQEILLALRAVSAVVKVNDSDGTVCKALEEYNPTYFGNGGDRTERNTPEQKTCDVRGIQCLWGLGGKKIRGSTPTFEDAVRELYGERAIEEIFGCPSLSNGRGADTES